MEGLILFVLVRGLVLDSPFHHDRELGKYRRDGSHRREHRRENRPRHLSLLTGIFFTREKSDADVMGVRVETETELVLVVGAAYRRVHRGAALRGPCPRALRTDRFPLHLFGRGDRFRRRGGRRRERGLDRSGSRPSPRPTQPPRQSPRKEATRPNRQMDQRTISRVQETLARSTINHEISPVAR